MPDHDNQAIAHAVIAQPIRYSDCVPSKIKDTKPPSDRRKVVSKVHSEAQRFADSLRQIIDRHALLIMRELSMNVRRFQDIEAQTKIGAPLLSSRLRRLERDGIIERRLYSEHPPRYEYFATEKGKDLDGVLFAAGNWNIKWGDLSDDPSLTIFDKATGQRLSAFPSQKLRKQSKKQTPGQKRGSKKTRPLVS